MNRTVDLTGDQSRRSFLKTSAVALPTAAVLAAAVADPAKAQLLPGRFIPNLYTGQNGRNFAEIRSDENTHVNYLVNALGSNARPKPTFQNLTVPTSNPFLFAALSSVLENTGVGAYLGAAPILSSSTVLAQAGSILAVEAYHSGYLNILINTPIVLYGSAFATPFTIDQVVSNASPFVASLNGGPPLTFSTTPSASNDIAILNFALALEYLEAEFYNLNVNRFFGV